MVTPPKKKRQHYVWQFYLSAWSTKKRVQCWRHGGVFQSPTRNLGVETYFYTLRHLDHQDNDHQDNALVEAIIAACAPHLREVAEGWHEVFTAPSRLARQMGSLPDHLAVAPEELLAAASELEEELHCQVENSGIPLLERLRAGKVPSRKDLYDVLPFLTVQYTRTRAIQESVLRATKAVTEPVWQVLRHVFASNMALEILRSGDYSADILRAANGERFITGDQPVVNIQGVWLPEGTQAAEVDLYYPVSPEFALHVSKGSTGTQRTLSSIEMNLRNATVARAAYEQVYAIERSDLDHVASDRGVIG